MPSLSDYARLAPFSLEELVQAANALLRGRPRLQVKERTVRFYISRGLLPPPTGSPKFARYSMEHLTRLVAARCMQDEGVTLEDIQAQLDRIMHGSPEAARAEIERRIERTREEQPLASRVVGENPACYAAPPSPASDRLEGKPRLEETRVVRLRLTKRAVLELEEGATLEKELDDCVAALQRLRTGPP